MRSFSKSLIFLALGTLGVALVPGCGSPSPPPRSEVHGEIVTEVPDVPGAEEPYPLPALGEKSASDTVGQGSP